MARARRKISLAAKCNDWFLRSKDKFYISIHHVFGHAGNGNECADIAASFGTNGFVSQCNVPSFWPTRHLCVQFVFSRSPLCHPHRRTFARCPFSPAVEPFPDDLLAVCLLVCVVRTLLLPFSPLARPFNAQEMEVQELSIRNRIT